jgi:hypothetical protein
MLFAGVHKNMFTNVSYIRCLKNTSTKNVYHLGVMFTISCDGPILKIDRCRPFQSHWLQGLVITKFESTYIQSNILLWNKSDWWFLARIPMSTLPELQNQLEEIS